MSAPQHPLNPFEIDVRTDSDVGYWVHAFGVNETELRTAVAEVGPSATEVRDYLGLARPAA